MIKLKWIIAILCFCLLPASLIGQEEKTVNLRIMYVDSLDRSLSIDKKALLSGKDSMIIIHFKGSVYQVFKQKGKYKVIQTLILEKQKNKQGGFETSFKSDTFFVQHNAPAAVIDQKKFEALFNFSNATGGKYVLNSGMSPKNDPYVRDLYVESLGAGQYKFQEVLFHETEMLESNNQTYRQILENIFEKFNHWKKLESMVKKKGPGVYSFNKSFTPGFFEYKSNGKFAFVGRPKEYSQMPQY